MATIDSYLDELLASDPPPAPRTSAAAADAPGCADDASAVHIAADVMAELMSDPALTGAVPAGAVLMPAHVEAASAAASRASEQDDDVQSRIAADLMAELMNDPALTGGAPAEAVPAAERAVEHRMPVIEPAPAPMRAPAMPDLSAFMPPTASPIAPVARTAVAAASAARTRTATGGHRWLRVCVGGDSYAFELLRVQEVVRVAPVVAMRGAGHAVLGVMNLRGRIVPVFDLGLWLDVGAVRSEERSRIVVIERNDELIGVLVTAVDDVVSLEREHVEPPLLGADPGPTLGVARVTAAPTVLLDADALFK